MLTAWQSSCGYYLKGHGMTAISIDYKCYSHIITHILKLRYFAMGQVTIYLEKEVEQKMVAAAKSAHSYSNGSTALSFTACLME